MILKVISDEAGAQTGNHLHVRREWHHLAGLFHCPNCFSSNCLTEYVNFVFGYMFSKVVWFGLSDIIVGQI